MTKLLALSGVLLAAAALFAACDDSSPGDDVLITTPTAAPAEGTSIGKIDRFPGGTAVITSDHTLISITCQTEQLVMTTSVAVFTGDMPCDRMVPADVVERFVQKPITITIDGGRLKIENPESGTLDFPATNVAQ
jgi:hypothetical protein